jgi:hypothetical protein
MPEPESGSGLTGTTFPVFAMPRFQRANVFSLHPPQFFHGFNCPEKTIDFFFYL